MKTRSLVAWLITFVLSVAIAVLAFQPRQIVAQTSSPPPDLFTPINTRNKTLLPSDTTVVRQRIVKANTSLLSATRGQSLTLNLFENARYQVQVEQVERSLEKPSTLNRSTSRGQKDSPTPVLIRFGRVQGIPESEVYLASRGDRLSASVRLPDGKLFEVSPKDTGLHIVRELNSSAFPPDEPPELYKRMQPTTRGRQRDAKQTTFDVLGKTPLLKVAVLYTPKAAEEAGGEEAMALLISRIQSQTNQGYRQSGINLRLSIEGWEQVDYTETGDLEKDLDRLTAVAVDQQIRKQARVDSVSLWVKSTKTFCGLGYVNQSPADFQAHAFNVVQLGCAANNFSFAHELGHNLGSCHDRDQDPKCEGSFAYSFGYGDPAGEFRTIMAYGCSGKKCPRRNVWSNPKLVVNKKPMGIEKQADNARSLNQVT